MELPTGSIHAIWSTTSTEFDVLGQRGLGLTMVVPDEEHGIREVPVYLWEGPWAERPPRGQKYTAEAALDGLRRASITLIRAWPPSRHSVNPN